MGELSQEALRVLQFASTGGLVLGALIAGACALVLAAAGGEQTRRAVLASSDAGRASQAQMANLRRQAAEAEERAAALGVRLAALEASLGDRAVAVRGDALPENEGSPPEAVLLTRLRRLEAALGAGNENQALGLGAASADAAREVLAPPAPPALPGEAAARIADALRPLSGEVSVEVASAPGEDARLYAAQISGAMRKAGLSVDGPFGVLTTVPADGLFVSTSGAGDQILQALQAEGLGAVPSPEGGPLTAVLMPEGRDVRIYVATAPSQAPVAAPGG